PGGSRDAFVAKLNATGSAFVYCTYLGGSRAEDDGLDIKVNSSGEAYLTGSTWSPDFPTVNAIQPTLGGVGDEDAFVAKINASGTALVYSTYLGGNSKDWGVGIALDTAGNVYLTGRTASPNFPTMNPVQQILASPGNYDAFVTKI